MNAGNRAKQYRKWLNSLPVIRKSNFDGISFELRQDLENNELVIVRYEYGKYDCSLLQYDYYKEYFDSMLKEFGLN